MQIAVRSGDGDDEEPDVPHTTADDAAADQKSQKLYKDEDHDLLQPSSSVCSSDVQRSLNFQTLVLKFKFDLHTFGIRISDYSGTTIKNGAMLLMFVTSS